jgi:hypothetical protein
VRRSELLRIARTIFPQERQPFSTPVRQLRTHHKHADVLGISRRYTPANSAAFDRALHDFVARRSTVRINGTYRRQPAIFYADYDTQRVVICRSDGSFWSIYKVHEEQMWHLWHNYSLGGG